ncbi:MAG: hypothetical protein ACPGRX_03760 [Bdellovibrionales bacterium]
MSAGDVVFLNPEKSADSTSGAFRNSAALGAANTNIGPVAERSEDPFLVLQDLLVVARDTSGLFETVVEAAEHGKQISSYSAKRLGLAVNEDGQLTPMAKKLLRQFCPTKEALFAGNKKALSGQFSYLSGGGTFKAHHVPDSKRREAFTANASNLLRDLKEACQIEHPDAQREDLFSLDSIVA